MYGHEEGRMHGHEEGRRRRHEEGRGRGGDTSSPDLRSVSWQSAARSFSRCEPSDSSVVNCSSSRAAGAVKIAKVHHAR